MSSLAPHPSVVCTVLEEGGVLLHLDTRYYYSLNRTGMAVWSALESGITDVSALAHAAGFESAPAGGVDTVRAFLADLETEKLVEPAVVTAGGAGAGGNGAGLAAAANGAASPRGDGREAPRLVRHDIPLNQILSNPFDPSVPLAE